MMGKEEDETPVRRAIRLAAGSMHNVYYQKARELVAKHGAGVNQLLEQRFQEIKERHEYDKVQEWFFICNYVGMVLRDGNATIQ
ncbi:hypothetical protein WBP07_29925 [Novosphingobium sp. BL-8A]|uniref:hypothetical protein n=1 Tax=Novosphingobium sp. BL-8A TaxID=3127639 RepID=UPI0037568E93